MKPNYYAIIPANVRYADISANAKLLYGEITALCSKEGYCWASNQHFAELYGVHKDTISNWVSELKDNNFVKIELTNNTTRHIYITDTLGENAYPPSVKTPRDPRQKDRHINKENNKDNTSEQSSAGEFEIVSDLEVKKKTPSRSKDIEAVFRLFNNPAWQTWKVRPLERKAAEVLYDTYGLEVLKKRLTRIALEKQKKDPYFPEVNTPSQLLDKMPNIERYLSI